jgi:predicted TIM-barrel fold metal-dependent hydrolase
MHEHIGSLDLAQRYVDAMDALGFRKMALLGSSEFTLTMRDDVGFVGYDANNEELLKIVEQYPGRFDAWPTINPEDPENLAKFQAIMARGATGLKLYTGHGYVNKASGKYMFHPMAMDDPRMFGIYDYCQKNNVPVLIHVNTGSNAPGFAEEFIAMLTRYPDLRVICPHFMLTSRNLGQLREFLASFPNVYSDISFGDAFMKDGLVRISGNIPGFQKLFKEYPDRFMFGTDLVLTSEPKKTVEWIQNISQAYLDMLTKDEYKTPLIPDQTLKGLKLPKEILAKVLSTNYESFLAARPSGTNLRRPVNWENMAVKKSQRKPGESLPPPKKK